MDSFIPFEEMPQRDIREAYEHSKRDWLLFSKWVTLPGFSLDELLSADIPDELSPDLEQEADDRAQLNAFVTMFSDEDGATERWERCPIALLSPIVRADGELVEVDLSFIARISYLSGLYSQCNRELSPSWKKRLSKYLTEHWPDYDGQEVTQRLLSDWISFTARRSMDKQNLCFDVP